MRAVRMGMCVVMGLILTSPVFAEESPDYLNDVTRQMRQQRQQDATDRQHRIMPMDQPHNEVRRPMNQRRLEMQPTWHERRQRYEHMWDD